jgi:hypothetical protein
VRAASSPKACQNEKQEFIEQILPRVESACRPVRPPRPTLVAAILRPSSRPPQTLCTTESESQREVWEKP